VAIPHEFAHGLYAIYNKVKIKTTGFGFFPYFLPVFLAAFVELDEKELSKRSKFGQMATLSAGTFANVLTGILFFLIMWGFFYVGFAPGGVMFDTYSYSFVNSSAIMMVNRVELDNGYDQIMELMNEDGINEIQLEDNSVYILDKELFEDPRSEMLFEESGIIVVYDNSPAIQAGLEGAISEFDGVKIENREDLVSELTKKSPGDEITIKTITPEGEKQYEIELAMHPEIEGVPWLGIGFLDRGSGSGILDKITNVIMFFREPHTYYKPVWHASEFIYNLLWWIVLISFSIALINMLPVGIFDGGRFFYLTILAITGSESKAKKSFKFITMLFLFFLFMILFFWMWGMFF
jgi:membrane-associated protease RseP (regulator of RpoE activity)